MIMYPFQNYLSLVFKAFFCTGILYMYKECYFNYAIDECGLMNEIECEFSHEESWTEMYKNVWRAIELFIYMKIVHLKYSMKTWLGLPNKLKAKTVQTLY